MQVLCETHPSASPGISCNSRFGHFFVSASVINVRALFLWSAEVKRNLVRQYKELMCSPKVPLDQVAVLRSKMEKLMTAAQVLSLAAPPADP